MSNKRRYYVTREVYDETFHEKHTILVYGELSQQNTGRGFIIAPITFNKKNGEIVDIYEHNVVMNPMNDNRPLRVFNFGWAICDAKDEFDLKEGIRVAKRRFSNSPMITTDSRFFSNDMINAILENELNFVESHLSEFFLQYGKIQKERKLEERALRQQRETENNGFEATRTDEVSEPIGDSPSPCYTDEDSDYVAGIEEEDGFDDIPDLKLDSTVDTENITRGDFICFEYNGHETYAVVKAVSDDDVFLCWRLTTYKNGYSFSTNDIISRSKTDFLTATEDGFNDAVNALREVFGWVWDRKNMRLYRED